MKHLSLAISGLSLVMGEGGHFRHTITLTRDLDLAVTLTFNPGVLGSRTKTQFQRSFRSKDRVETNERTDGWTDGRTTLPIAVNAVGTLKLHWFDLLSGLRLTSGNEQL